MSSLMSSLSRHSLRDVSRRLIVIGLGAAAMLLSACVSTYGYRGGEGDYYYAEPQIEYYGYGPYGSTGYVGDGYGSVAFHHGGHSRFGGDPYYGYSRSRYSHYRYPHYRSPYRYYYGYYYGYPYSDYGYRPPRPRPPVHHNPPTQHPPTDRPPPAADGSDPDYDPRDLRDREGDHRWRHFDRRRGLNSQRPDLPRADGPSADRPRSPVAVRGSQPRLPPREAPQSRPSAPTPVAPARRSPPPAAPQHRPVYSERPVRDENHEP